MTITEIDEILVELKAAYKAAASGKAYTINTGGTSRAITRNDLTVLRGEIKQWETERAQLVTGTGIKTKFITGAEV